MPEFDLIGKLQQAICLPDNASNGGCIVGIGDDAAVLEIPPDRELVVTTDTLVNGVHFPRQTDPEAIGHKALAVNLSDLAAMGANPTHFFLALTLPEENTEWLEAFTRGMSALARRWGVELSGGDTTSGPLSITITALGAVEQGRSLLRSGARPGDRVVISGAIGEAAWALEQIQNGLVPAIEERTALDYPQPRVALGRALDGLATSCIDLSDGLAADLGHILERSGVGARIELECLPRSDRLEQLPDADRWRLQLSGGDDYELCFTVPESAVGELDRISKSVGVALTPIGNIVAGEGVEWVTESGDRIVLPVAGYVHFAPDET